MPNHTESGTDRLSRRNVLKAGGLSGLAGMSMLAGCAGGDGQDTQTTDETTTETTTDSTAGSEGDVKIGFPVPLSGPLAGNGEDEQRGARLALNYVNEELGGINGRNVVGLFEDTQTDPATGQEVARKLVEDDGVDALIGAVSGAVSLSIAEYAYEQRVPYFTYGGSDSLTGADCKPTTFRYSYSASQDAKAGVPWALDNLGSNVWIHFADYSFGQSIRDTWRSELEDADANIVNVTGTPLGTEDYSSYISQIQSSNADWVLTALSGTDAINFLNQADQFNLKEQVDIMSPLNSQQALRKGAGSAAVNTYALIRYDYKFDSPANEPLVSSYTDEHGEPPSDPAMVTWASLVMYAEAASNAESVAVGDVVSTLEGMEFEAPMGPMTMRACDHQALRDYPVGEIVPADEYDWPALEILDTRPAAEITTPCEETGCEMPSL